MERRYIVAVISVFDRRIPQWSKLYCDVLMVSSLDYYFVAVIFSLFGMIGIWLKKSYWNVYRSWSCLNSYGRNLALLSRLQWVMKKLSTWKSLLSCEFNWNQHSFWFTTEHDTILCTLKCILHWLLGKKVTWRNIGFRNFSSSWTNWSKLSKFSTIFWPVITILHSVTICCFTIICSNGG